MPPLSDPPTNGVDTGDGVLVGDSLHEEKANRRLQAIVIFVLSCSVCLFLWLASTTESWTNPEHVILRTNKIVRNDEDDAACLALCNTRRNQRSQHFFPDESPLSTTETTTADGIASSFSTAKDFIDTDRLELIKLIQRAKHRLIAKLKIDYGEDNFNAMFVDGTTYRPFYPITPGGKSYDKLKRRIMIKLLKAQLSSKERESNVHGLCDCISNKPLRGNINVTAESTVVETIFERYVWATGGHSASAAHGNMFNESYTAFMERDLIDIFGSVGIEFEGRNYAMGGTPSAPEIAMCWEEVFGSDVDIFSWDYGMTDGNEADKLFFYGYRGGLSPGQPAIVGIHLGGRSRGQREGRLQTLESLGMASFFADDGQAAKQRDAIPDSAGLTSEENLKMPFYVRNFKCGGQIEKGEPYCANEKFSDYACQQRIGKASWHPGHKDHAMVGHSMSLFMTEALLAAAKDLAEHENKDSQDLLQKLEEDDNLDFESFKKNAIDDKYTQLLTVPDEVHANFSSSVFYTRRSFCHTARTPSRSRYLGYLTNTDKVGGPAPFGQETYDVGIEDFETLKNPTEDGSMRLTWKKGRQRKADCEYIVAPDYKDWFDTHDKDGWTKIVMPNVAEREAYRYQPSEVLGIVVFVFLMCDWGKCPAGFLKEDHYAEKKWEMKINGQPVVSIHNMGHDAIIAKGKDGIYFPPNNDGVYEIEIKVNEERSFVMISSFIIY